MADDLPDAPWASGGGGDAAAGADTLPDAPWAAKPPADTSARAWARSKTEIGPDQRSSIFGTPVPKRPDSYGGTLDQFYDEAEDKMRTGVKSLVEASDPRRPAMEKLTQPFKTAGALADIATGAAQGMWAPATAAVRHYVTGAQERYTGIPAEDVEGAVLGGAGPKIGRGAASPLRMPPAPAAVPRTAEQIAAATDPRKGSALSVPGTLQRTGPVDMEALGREIEAPPAAAAVPDMGQLERDLGAGDIAGPSAQEQAPLATPREGLSPNVRMLPPEVPHDVVTSNPELRDSVGAARARSALEGASPEAVKVLEDVARNEGWTEHTLEQLEESQSAHHMLGETSDNLANLTKAVQTMPGPASNEVRQAVNARHYEQPERLDALHTRYLGPAIDPTQWEKAMQAAAKQESAPFWREFDSKVITPTPEIDAVLQRPGMRRALGKANETLLNRGQPIENGFPVLTEEEGGNSMSAAARQDAEEKLRETRVPTARAFQLAKEALDDRIGAAVRAGEKGDVRTYTTLKKDLDAAIAAHPDESIAQVWKQARQTYRGPMSLINARDLGRELLNRGTRWSEVPGIVDGMSPPERQALLLGMRDDMAETAGRGGPQGLKQIREVIGTNNRRKIAAVIGDEPAEAYFRALEHEEHMHFALRRLIHGSDTGQNIAYQQMLQEQPGLMSRLSLGDVAGAIAHPVRTGIGMAGKGVDALQAGHAARANEHWENVVRPDLGRLLTTQGPERDAIRRELVRRAQQHPLRVTVNPRSSPGLNPITDTTRAKGGRVVPPRPKGESYAAWRERIGWATGGRVVRAMGGHVDRHPISGSKVELDRSNTFSKSESGIFGASTNDASRDAKMFGDAADAHAIRVKGFDLLDRYRQHVVLAHVIAALHDRQVLRRVIEAVPVDVVDVLIGQKWTPKSLLHDPSVLTHRLSVPSDTSVLKPVSRFIDTLAAVFKLAFASGDAKKSSLSFPFPMSENKGSPAIRADSFGRLIHRDVIHGREIETHVNPSHGQKEAGNYLKGATRVHGLEIKIENPRGTWRQGTDAGGKPWKVKMPAHYGYLKGTVGRDKDHVDVYVGPCVRCQRTWVIDQKNDAGGFDEHKAFIGFTSEAQVRRIYAAAFSDGCGHERIGAIKELHVDALRDWLKSGDTTKPISKAA